MTAIGGHEGGGSIGARRIRRGIATNRTNGGISRARRRRGSNISGENGMAAASAGASGEIYRSIAMWRQTSAMAAFYRRRRRGAATKRARRHRGVAVRHGISAYGRLNIARRWRSASSGVSGGGDKPPHQREGILGMKRAKYRRK